MNQNPRLQNEFQRIDNSETEVEISKKYSLKFYKVPQFLKKDLPIDLITPKSKNILQQFQLNSDFLHTDPMILENNENYRQARDVIQGIKVVNDLAE